MEKQRSKFNVSKDKSKRTYDGMVFDSEIEMTYYRDWVLPKIASGEIIKCERQVKYELQPEFIFNGKKQQAIIYKSDFDITFKDGKFVVVDTKGMVKPMDSLKKKMFNYKYPDLELIWIGKSKIDGGYVSLDIIKQGRKQRKTEKEKKSKTTK